MNIIGKRNSKAQSAMEYLMTYGWAILIIAVVLAVLFSLGIFNAGAFVSQSCTAVAGYQCASPSLSGFTGNAAITIGTTSTTLFNVAVAFVPTTAGLNGYGAPTVPATWNALTTMGTGVASNTLTPGVPVTIASLPVSAPSTPIRTSVSGSIWLAYTTNTGVVACPAPPATSPVCSYTQIGAVTFKAS